MVRRTGYPIPSNRKIHLPESSIPEGVHADNDQLVAVARYVSASFRCKVTPKGLFLTA
jgi:hypothetical protein